MNIWKLITLNIFIISNALNIKSMFFNLNKDSLWISYPMKRTGFRDLSKMIPESQVLTKCKVFPDDKLDYRLFFNLFEVNTPFFKGNRLEIVTITKNLITNKPSFVILDCYTNVMTWDPIYGIQDSNSNFKKKINNNRYDITVSKKTKEKEKSTKKSPKSKNYRLFYLKSRKSSIKLFTLKEFSIEPNYICYFKNYPIGYELIFKETEIDKKIQLLKDVNLKNKLFNDYIKELEHIFIYPQKMNFKVIINN